MFEVLMPKFGSGSGMTDKEREEYYANIRGLKGKRDSQGNLIRSGTGMTDAEREKAQNDYFKAPPDMKQDSKITEREYGQDAQMAEILSKVQTVLSDAEFDQMLKYLLGGGMK